MNLELTTQQQRQIDVLHGQPPQVVDPRTKTTYVLNYFYQYKTQQRIWEVTDLFCPIALPYKKFGISRNPGC